MDTKELTENLAKTIYLSSLPELMTGDEMSGHLCMWDNLPDWKKDECRNQARAVLSYLKYNGYIRF
jgi:hypothetical protein